MVLMRRLMTALLAGSLAAGLLCAQGRNQGQPAKPNTPRQSQQQPRQNAQPKVNQPAGDEIFMRLQRMTPEEREKALQKLPPAQRERIENRIQNFQNLPPAVQERRLNRLEKLNSLPKAEQKQVRQSMRDLQKLPDDRKRAINQELRRMAVMGDDEKQYHMNTEEFRSRFSPAEQEMVGNLSKVFPSKE